jgi:hypothetical protein
MHTFKNKDIILNFKNSWILMFIIHVFIIAHVICVNMDDIFILYTKWHYLYTLFAHKNINNKILYFISFDIR